jgi:hypothetical protein
MKQPFINGETMRTAAFVFVVAFASLALAQPRPLNAPAPVAGKVTAVTVYQGNALVTREVDVPAGQGLVEIVVSPLPPQTIDSSLYTEGTDGMRVLSTRYRTRAVKDDTRAEVRALQDQIKKLHADAQRIAKETQVAEQNLAFVTKLEQFTASTMSTLVEKGLLNSENTIALSKHVMQTRGELSQKVVELQQQTEANREAADFANRQLSELSAGASRTERDAVIVVDKANNAAGKVNLNYLVSAATWRPQYKLRAGAEKDPIQLE